jgi:hypothetical protein
MNPFDYAHDLITKEKHDDDVPDRKDYKQFLINRTLSYHGDLIHHINEMNRYPDIGDKPHYDFVYSSVSKKKRKKKYWAKGKKYENLQIVKEYYNYSNTKAIIALSVLSDKDIKNIKDRLFRGGVS